MTDHSHAPSGWTFQVDRGGTFTDIIAVTPGGELRTAKLLSENPRHYDDAVIAGIRQLMAVSNDQGIPTEAITAIRMGTTVATNALLEHQGEPVLLLVTKGFADVLRIGTQHRPDLFALNIHLPEMLYQAVEEVDERIDAQGIPLRAPDPESVRRILSRHHQNGLRSCAILFMHSYRNPAHERTVAQIALETGFTQVSVSHALSPLIKIVSRGDTTVVDAYLSPVLHRYIRQVSGALKNVSDLPGKLLFMQSNGGLTDANCFHGKDAILSGPAGGVVGMIKTGEAAGFERLIGFDMGGTSTDVSHYCGQYERRSETRVAGFRLQTPMLSVHTIAAGGGSIVSFDGIRYRVGPASAGSNPGPCAYGNGGPLTITDCNVLLGRIHPNHFPKVFGPNQNAPLDRASVERQFAALSRQIQDLTGDTRDSLSVAAGFLKIAVDNMAHAVQHISTQRGFDLKTYTLCSFGGAGAQHACQLAERLGMSRILLHPYAGVLSAFGIGLADQRELIEQSIEQPLSQTMLASLTPLKIELSERLTSRLSAQGVKADALTICPRLQLKLKGSDQLFLIEWGTEEQVRDTFLRQFQLQFGYQPQTREVMIHALQIEGVGHSQALLHAHVPRQNSSADLTQALVGRHPVAFEGQIVETPFYDRDRLPYDAPLAGPCIITEPSSTIVIEPRWQAVRRPDGNLILERTRSIKPSTTLSTDVDPVMLEVFNNLFMFIAEEMGLVLQNAAVSVNIKERLDFSCALFDAKGELVANAPHMPVHLGSMSHSIRSIKIQNQDADGRTRMRPGDVYMLNDPYAGGTHLPDVTVVKPLFDASGHHLRFFVAARGHHADIGGITPGSMPSHSTHIDQEGILLNNIKIVSEGVFQDTLVKQLLLSGPNPARNIDYSVADLQAQIAACESGSRALDRIVSEYGESVVHAYMEHVQNHAEQAVRNALGALQDGTFTCPLDNGTEIKVRISVNTTQKTATLDFTGTSPQSGGNYNAPLAIVHAAVLYVFRCLVNDNIPLNAGCLKPLTLIVPEGSLLNPRYPAAVVAGNVEVSQAVVDALFGALGIKAAAQGSMNNLTWGNARVQYYETLCGGDGATATANGASAVHTHMTNSRLTDPEVLELRFPVRLESFSIRRHSGGRGRFRGGDGVIRQIRFLEAMQVNLLSNRRKVSPFGLAGGQEGKTGRNEWVSSSGEHQDLPSQCQLDVQPGDLLILSTPGGGGYGLPDGTPNEPPVD